MHFKFYFCLESPYKKGTRTSLAIDLSKHADKFNYPDDSAVFV